MQLVVKCLKGGVYHLFNTEKEGIVRTRNRFWTSTCGDLSKRVLNGNLKWAHGLVWSRKSVCGGLP